MSVRLIRFDLGSYAYGSNKTDTKSEKLIPVPNSRDQLIHDEGIPSDSVIKLKSDGKFIPWSFIHQFQNVEIQILRPHQHSKPKLQKYMIDGDGLIRSRVKRLENRINSLEKDADPEVMKKKLEKDIDILSKQIAFLNKRIQEADSAEWIKNPDLGI